MQLAVSRASLGLYRASQLVEGSKTAVVSRAQLVLRLELVGMNDDNSRLDGEMHNPSFNKFNLQSSHWISLEKKSCQGSWVSWPCLRVTWDYKGGAGRNINCEKMMPTPCSLLLKLDLHAPWHPTQYTRENHSWHSQTDLNHSCNLRAFSLFLQSWFTFAWHQTGKPGHFRLNTTCASVCAARLHGSCCQRCQIQFATQTAQGSIQVFQFRVVCMSLHQIGTDETISVE